jgi:hypothetical protein
MAKLPKFLLCENEQAELDGEYVLHTQQPRFLAKRIYDDASAAFSVVDDMDDMTAYFEGDTQKRSALMASLSEWYNTYQDYLEEQYGEDED